jgi:hypothetical protein
MQGQEYCLVDVRWRLVTARPSMSKSFELIDARRLSIRQPCIVNSPHRGAVRYVVCGTCTKWSACRAVVSRVHHFTSV